MHLCRYLRKFFKKAPKQENIIMPKKLDVMVLFDKQFKDNIAVKIVEFQWYFFLFYIRLKIDFVESIVTVM